jgi:hypothetical protein
MSTDDDILSRERLLLIILPEACCGKDKSAMLR